MTEVIALGKLFGIDDEALQLRRPRHGIELPPVANHPRGMAFALVGVVALPLRDFEVKGCQQAEGRLQGTQIVELLSVGAKNSRQEGCKIAAAGGTTEREVTQLTALKFGRTGPGEHLSFVADGDIEPEAVPPNDLAGSCDAGSGLNQIRAFVRTTCRVPKAILHAGNGLHAGIAGSPADVVDNLLPNLIEQGLGEGDLREGTYRRRE